MAEAPSATAPAPGAAAVARAWGRIGATGFGGPPTHVALLRRLCVEDRGWLSAREFEDAIAACNLLPGPASTQLAIYCAGRVAGRRGALVGGLCFIAPGLVAILVLAAVIVSGTPPVWLRALAAGGGAAVAAVALRAGGDLLAPSLRAAGAGPARLRWAAYLLAGAVAAAAVGPWLVLVLIACGALELGRNAPGRRRAVMPITLATHAGGWAVLAWSALKVGALSFGGGFVIIPLMQSDAVSHHWMTPARFLDAVALGQITPGPVTQTVAVVGYAAGGLAGGLLAATVAFAPSFGFVLAGGRHFERVRVNPSVRAFLRGAGPAAVGAILGSAVPLAGALSERWQDGVLVVAAGSLIVARRSVVGAILTSAALGLLASWAGQPIPR